MALAASSGARGGDAGGEPRYIVVKENFYFVEAPEVREHPWYLLRKPGQGIYAEVAKDAETGVFIAPWPFNKRITVEEGAGAEERAAWESAGAGEVIMRAYGAIIELLAKEKEGEGR
ncbi:MAG: hypothetical protein AB7W37_13535 [Syntrophobacteraceae bacterium]